jgi:hypothetical protein
MRLGALVGRKKRLVHPWTSQDHALAECIKGLGDDGTSEGVEAFQAASREYRGWRPSGDQFVPWVADLLSVLERKRSVRITGRLATLLSLAAGGPPVRSEDRFERSRKTWDEAIRRARQRVAYDAEEIAKVNISRVHETMAYGELRHPGPYKATAESVRANLVFHLEVLRQVAQRLTLRELNAVLRRIEAIRYDLLGGRR